MKKLLRHLTNTPVAVALAFLLVGAPSAPMAKMLPSSGEAQACRVYVPSGTSQDYDMSGQENWHGDADCDGLADQWDPCPTDWDNNCNEVSLMPSWPVFITQADCFAIVDAYERALGAIAATAAIVALISPPVAAVVVAMGALVWVNMQLRELVCTVTYP